MYCLHRQTGRAQRDEAVIRDPQDRLALRRRNRGADPRQRLLNKGGGPSGADFSLCSRSGPGPKRLRSDELPSASAAARASPYQSYSTSDGGISSGTGKKIVGASTVALGNDASSGSGAGGSGGDGGTHSSSATSTAAGGAFIRRLSSQAASTKCSSKVAANAVALERFQPDRTRTPRGDPAHSDRSARPGFSLQAGQDTSIRLVCRARTWGVGSRSGAGRSDRVITSFRGELK